MKNKKMVENFRKGPAELEGVEQRENKCLIQCGHICLVFTDIILSLLVRFLFYFPLWYTFCDSHKGLWFPQLFTEVAAYIFGSTIWRGMVRGRTVFSASRTLFVIRMLSTLSCMPNVEVSKISSNLGRQCGE